MTHDPSGYDFDHAVIFNTMSEGVYVHDQDMTITYINPAAGVISGWHPDEAVGKKCWQVFADESSSCRDICPLQAALAAGRSVVTQERSIRQRTGEAKKIQVTLTSYRKAGAEAGAIVIVRDVSDCTKTIAAYQQEILERRQAEETLARRNEILSEINRLQEEFFLEEPPEVFFSKLVGTFCRMTKSRLGFIAEVAYLPNEDLCLQWLAVKGIPPEADILGRAQDYNGQGPRLTSLDNLLGSVIRSGRVVIANDPLRDPRRGTMPPGHPPLSSFFGIPLFAGKNLIGILGLANRPGGYDQALAEEIEPVANAAANLMKAYCAERERRGHDHLVRTMADTIQDVFWINDLQRQTTIFASKSYESVWGLSLDSLYQTPNAWAESIHSADKARVAAAFARIGEGQRFDEIYRIIRPDGETRWIRDHGYPIIRNNTVLQAAGIAQDITTWRQMELDAIRMRRQIELILGVAKTGLSVVDTCFSLRYVDPATVTRYGSYEGKKCYEYFKGQVRLCVECAMIKAMASGEPYVEESCIPAENNRPVQKSVYPFDDESGERLFAVVTVDISRSKQAEQALSDSERLYRELVETTSAITWEMDLDSRRFNYVGPQAAAILGYPPEAWTDFAFWSELIVPEDRDAAVSACLEAIARGQDHRLEYRMLTRDGRQVWIHDTVSVISENGRPKTLRGFFFDISSLKESEAALCRSVEILALHNRLLELSFKSLPLAEVMEQCLAIITSIPWIHVQAQGAIFLKDHNLDELVLQAHAGLGQEIVAACGRVPFGVCLCGQAAQSGAVLWVNHIDEHSHTISYPGIKPHGHFCVPFFSSRQQLLGVITLYTEAEAARDSHLEETLVMLAKVLALIIERKQFEDMIIEARDEWARTFDAVTDMIMVIDRDHRVVRVNKAMVERLGGNSAEQFVGGHCYHLIHESECPLEGCPHVLTLQDGKPHSGELHHTCLDGDFVVSVAPVVKDGGRVLSSVHVIHDRSEQKQHERQLQQFADTQAVLLREINHRVKNNLTAIISMIHKEKDRACKGKRSQVEVALSEVESRIEGLLTVHSLLSASQWQPLALTDLCREVAQRAAACAAKSQQVVFDILPSEALVTSDQAHHMALVINELTTNTIKYAIGERGCCRITITISRGEGAIAVIYRDDGPGFPQEVLQGLTLSAGIGFELIGGIVRKSLRGTLSLANDGGGVVTIRFAEK